MTGESTGDVSGVSGSASSEARAPSLSVLGAAQIDGAVGFTTSGGGRVTGGMMHSGSGTTVATCADGGGGGGGGHTTAVMGASGVTPAGGGDRAGFGEERVIGIRTTGGGGPLCLRSRRRRCETMFHSVSMAFPAVSRVVELSGVTLEGAPALFRFFNIATSVAGSSPCALSLDSSP